MLKSAPTIETMMPELLTLKQAADLCGVSERTLWDWARTDIAPAPLKIGKGIVRYARAAYLAWINDGCQPISVVVGKE